MERSLTKDGVTRKYPAECGVLAREPSRRGTPPPRDMLGVEAVAERMGERRRPSPDDARRRQDGAGRRCHRPPRKQFACIHDDNPPVSMQDDGPGEFSWAASSDGTR
jgi:hypothetical protein